MQVNPVQVLPLASLRHNQANPKKPMGSRYLRGLRASLSRFGFSSVFIVAGPDPDGTYEVLDGNTRLDELDGQTEEAPCIVLDLDADARREFVLSHDRNRKLFDEEAVVSQLRDLAQRGKDVKALADLTATDNLRQLLEASTRATAQAQPTTQARIPQQGSLILYGSQEDIEAVKQLTKRIRGRMAPLIKVRQALEQADAFADLSDESFLLLFCSTLARFSDG